MNKITNTKIWDAIDERIDRVVEQSRDREEALENRIKELENHNINNIIKRVKELEDWYNDNKIKALKNHNINSEDLAELVDTHTIQINHINDGLRQLENELKLDDFQIRKDFDNLCIRIIDYLEESKENTIKSNKALKNEAEKLGINLNEGGE